MISVQTLRVCREGKPLHSFPDHALALFGLLREPLQEALDLAVLLTLAVGPFPDHLLLGAHMRYQPLDRLGEVRHRCSGAPATASFLDSRPQPLERDRNLAGRAALIAIMAHGGGKPVLEIGVEAVLRLARLQIEEAEDQGASEAEQRGRERDAHAAERRGKALFQRIEQRTSVTADFESIDDIADRAHGLDQTPKGAEQAEEDQEPGHVAGNVASLVE